MNGVCVKADSISKRFVIPKTNETTLRVVKALLRHRHLTKEIWALRDVSFEVKKGEKLALVGRNGSGKTTLLRILMGVYEATSGRIETSETPQAMLRFWSGVHGDLSVIDNIFLFGTMHGMDRAFLMERLHGIFTISGLRKLEYSPLKRLSLGQLQRLALAVFMQSPGDFLIFDESLEYVDEGFFIKCGEYFSELVSSGKTVIMTNHDSSFLRKYCRTAIWLDEGRIRMQGEVNEVIDEYERLLS